MCKIFAITDMSGIKLTNKLLEVIKTEVCKYDKDGFGYSVLNQDGTIGGERTINPKQFQALTPGSGETEVEKLPFITKTYNKFGTIKPDSVKTLIAHGRLSTNNVDLPHTHPFVSEHEALIHNGVVQDVSGLVDDLLETDNDSEVLFRYWQHGGMEAVEEHVSGYYAFAVLNAKTGKLHIARDNRAMLHMAWCRTINSYIIATTKDIIHNVAKRMKWKIDAALEVNANTYVVFDGNEPEYHRPIEPYVGITNDALEDSIKKALGERVTFIDSTTYNSYNDDSGLSYKQLSEIDSYSEINVSELKKRRA